MPDADTATTYLAAAQLLVVLVSVVYLAIQVRGERVAQGFQAYAQVNDAYMRHLWLASEDPELNDIWEPLAGNRREELDAAQRAGSWGAWHAMSIQERKCYRYTRLALEIFEQAWEVNRRGMIGSDTWCKWEQWMLTWHDTRYFDYVYDDSKPRLLSAFCSTVEEVGRRRRNGAPQASSR